MNLPMFYQMMSCRLTSIVAALVVLSGTASAQGACDSYLSMLCQSVCLLWSSAVTPTAVYMNTPQSFDGIPTDPKSAGEGHFDGTMAYSVPNRLTDNVLGTSSPVNFTQFSAWSRAITPMLRIYFQFPELNNFFIRQIDLYFYKNASRVGLPDVRLHVTSTVTAKEDQFVSIPFTIISNHSMSDIEGQTVRVSLVDTINQGPAGYVNNVIVRMTFNFNHSDTLDWMLISEVMMFTDTGECNDHDHDMSE